jgi:hypothetical protein
MIKIIPDDTCSKSIKPGLREIPEILSEIKPMDYPIELCVANVHANRATNLD